MLLTVGDKQGELQKIALAEMGDAEIQDLVKQKLFAVMVNNGQRQKIVPASEVEKSMAEGWEWIGNLADGRAILRLPLVTA